MTIQQDQRGRGVVTNGEGKHCTSHLNLTKTIGPEPRITNRYPNEYLPEPGRTPYAGYDVRDKGWRK